MPGAWFTGVSTTGTVTAAMTPCAPSSTRIVKLSASLPAYRLARTCVPSCV